VPSTYPATCTQDVVDWTLGEGKHLRLAQLIPGFCERLTEAGMPILRCSVHIRQLHPQYYSRGFFWNRGEAKATESPREHGIENTPAYLDSPLYTAYEPISVSPIIWSNGCPSAGAPAKPSRWQPTIAKGSATPIWQC
jgi:hypothetical protein